MAATMWYSFKGVSMGAITDKKMENLIICYMGGCQNSGPFLGTLNIRCRTMIGTQKGAIILTTTHIGLGFSI